MLLSTVTVALLAAGFRGSSPPALGPGSKIGAMTLVRGNEHEADQELMGAYCAPLIPKPGRYNRTCRAVPRVVRLFIGYGDSESTMKASAGSLEEAEVGSLA